LLAFVFSTPLISERAMSSNRLLSTTDEELNCTDMTEDKSKYMAGAMRPVLQHLQDAIANCLNEMPEDPKRFIQEWLGTPYVNRGSTRGSEQAEALECQQQLEETTEVEQLRRRVATLTRPGGSPRGGGRAVVEALKQQLREVLDREVATREQACKGKTEELVQPAVDAEHLPYKVEPLTQQGEALRREVNELREQLRDKITSLAERAQGREKVEAEVEALKQQLCNALEREAAHGEKAGREESRRAAKMLTGSIVCRCIQRKQAGNNGTSSSTNEPESFLTPDQYVS